MSETMNATPWLTVAEVCQRSRLSRASVLHAIAEKLLLAHDQAQKKGGRKPRWLIHVDDCDRWIMRKPNIRRRNRSAVQPVPNAIGHGEQAAVVDGLPVLAGH